MLGRSCITTPRAAEPGERRSPSSTPASFPSRARPTVSDSPLPEQRRLPAPIAPERPERGFALARFGSREYGRVDREPSNSTAISLTGPRQKDSNARTGIVDSSVEGGITSRRCLMLLLVPSSIASSLPANLPSAAADRDPRQGSPRGKTCRLPRARACTIAPVSGSRCRVDRLEPLRQRGPGCSERIRRPIASSP